MKKYIQIAKNTWDEALIYRTSFIFYRVRELLKLFSLYFLWYFVTSRNGDFFGYDQSGIITYLLISTFVGDFIFSTRTTAIASEINEGILTNFLVRPLSYLKYYFARDIGDKALNVSFALVEYAAFFAILRPPFIFQENFILILIFITSVLLGVILYFFISVLISLIGFWSNEGWGPRFIFYQVIGFISGSLFPLDVLPKPLFALLELLPFPYLIFFQSKIYQGQLSGIEIGRGFLILILWIFIMYFITLSVWKKGLRVYTAQGR